MGKKWLELVRVETYRHTAPNGTYVCMATKVVMPDGKTVRILENLPKLAAVRKALKLIDRGQFEFSN